MDPNPVHNSIRGGEGGRCPKSYDSKEADIFSLLLFHDKLRLQWP